MNLIPTCIRRATLSAGLLSAGVTLAARPAAEPAPLVTFRGHTDPVYAVAVDPDGKTVATGSFDKSIKLWDAATGKEIRTLAGDGGHQGLVLSVAFAPAGDLLASGGADNTARVWEVATGKMQKSLPHPNLVDAVAFDPSGKRLATAGHDGILRVFDVAKGGQPVKTINAHTQPQANPVYTVAWSPDGKAVATGSFDKSIKLWDAAAGTLLREIKPSTDKPPVPKAVGTAAPAVTGTAGAAVLNAPPSVGHRDKVFSLAFSPDGKLLASGSSDRTVKLWAVGTGESVRAFPNPSLKPAVAGDPHPSHPGFVHAVRFTPNGKRLISVGTAPRNQGYIAVWDVATGKSVTADEVPFGPVYAVELLGDGKAVIGCGPKQRGQSDSEAHVIELPK